jgi:hypothetical protein
MGWIKKLATLVVSPPLELIDFPGGSALRLKGGTASIRAKITSQATGGGFYNGKSVTGSTTGIYSGSNLSLPDSGETVASAEDTIIENAPESGLASSGAGSHWLAVGAFVNGLIIGYSSDTPPKPVIRVYEGNPYEVFALNLTSITGTTGSQTTPPSYQYTAVDLNGNTIGTTMSPTTGRTNGNFTAATDGEGYYNASSTFVLLRAHEAPGTTACTG